MTKFSNVCPTEWIHGGNSTCLSLEFNIPLTSCLCHCEKYLSSSLFSTHIFLSNLMTLGLINLQRGAESKDMCTTCECEQFLTTSKVCKKSPPKTVVILPNSCKESHRSLSIQLTASMAKWCCTEHTSQIISLAVLIKAARLEHFPTAHIESSRMSKGTLKVEWAILPPGSNCAAIPK